MPLIRRERNQTSVESGPTPARNAPTANRPDIGAPAAPRWIRNCQSNGSCSSPTPLSLTCTSCPLAYAPSSIPRLRSMW